MVEEVSELELTRLILVAGLVRDQERNGRVHGVKRASVVGPVVRYDGLRCLQFIQWNCMFLNDFNGKRCWYGEIPDLLSFCLGILKDLSNIGCIHIPCRFAQQKVGGDDLWKILTVMVG